MNTIILTRFAYLEDCTLGHMILPNGAHLYSIERPWFDNEPFVSCIPDGVYPLEWDATGRILNVPRLRNTEPRTQINIHAANYASQLHGCIAPGLGYDLGKRMVTNSKKAMALLMEWINPAELAYADGESLNRDILITSSKAA